jgi:hypothetical protein
VEVLKSEGFDQGGIHPKTEVLSHIFGHILYLQSNRFLKWPLIFRRELVLLDVPLWFLALGVADCESQAARQLGENPCHISLLIEYHNGV